MSTVNNSPGRSYGIFLFLIAILIMVVIGYLYPRNPTIPTQTVKDIVDATAELKKTAENVEKNTAVTAALTRTLIKQMTSRTEQDDEGYNKLLKQWGIDLNSPDGDLPSFDGMYEQSHNDRSGNLLPGEGGANQVRPLQGTDKGFQSSPHGSASGITYQPARASS